MTDNTSTNSKGHAQAMLYASVLLREKELPTPEGEDLEWIRLFRKAYDYWRCSVMGSYGCHWALEADKYDFLDQENVA
jgi:hypothetical protein